jgi:mRNA interferase MazF
VLVISREAINRSLPIVAVLPLTTCKPGRKIYSSEVLIPAGAAGQPVDSVALGHQIRTISRRRLGERYGELTDPEFRQGVRSALKVFLNLEE